MTELTQYELKKQLHYDPDTGIFSRPMFVCEQSRFNAQGHLFININNEYYSARRLAYLYMTGHMPAGYLFSINGNKGDFRWGNLTTDSKNAKRAVQKLSPHNKSGVTGVRYDPGKKKWVASYRGEYIGAFDEKGDAVAARQIAEIM